MPPPTVSDVGVTLSRAEGAAYASVLAATRSLLRSRAPRAGPGAVRRARLLRGSYVSLRQAACHPQAGAGRRGATLAPVGGERMTMAAVMDRLVRVAAAKEASARRALSAAELQLAAVRREPDEVKVALARVGGEAAFHLSQEGGDPTAVVRRRGADGGLPAPPPDWLDAAAGGVLLATGAAAAGVRAAATTADAGRSRGRPAADADDRPGAAAAAWASLYADGLDLLPMLGADPEGTATAAAERLRAALGGAGDAEPVGPSSRFSKRKRGMDATEELAPAAAAALEATHAAQRESLFVRQARALAARRDAAAPGDARRRGGVDAAAAAVATAERAAAATFGGLKHKLSQRAAFRAEAGTGGGGGGGERDDDDAADPDATDTPVNDEDDGLQCPCCYDALAGAEAAVTPCGHVLCHDCAVAAIEARGACPLCRAALRVGDLVTAVPDAAAAAEAADPVAAAAHDFGAKLGALVKIVADGDGKTVIFSAWSSLLRLAAAALAAAGVASASLAGAAPPARAAALASFRADPDVRALLVVLSTSGGAAGLTLTEANTVVLLEPCLNPGLEAQAASRVARLGQTRPTRLLRITAGGTIDVPVAALAAERAAAAPAEAGAAAPGGLPTDIDEGTVRHLLEAHP